jgi:hypothetical protein
MFMQRRLPSPGFQVEVVILDHDVLKIQAQLIKFH